MYSLLFFYAFSAWEQHPSNILPGTQLPETKIAFFSSNVSKNLKSTRFTTKMAFLAGFFYILCKKILVLTENAF